jgi:hypothetical protein
MKKFFALLPVLWLLIWIVVFATEISVNEWFLSEKTNTDPIVSTLSEIAHFGYLAAIQK